MHFEALSPILIYRGGKSSSGGYEGGGKNLHLDEGFRSHCLNINGVAQVYRREVPVE